MQLLDGKNALVFGVANDHSIAWGISRAMHEHGAQLAFSYAAETLERRVRPLAESVGSDFVELCDVADDKQIEALC
jgi:enoyl-[acyl-carrier protein] reductase I